MITMIGSCLVLMTTTWLGFQKARIYADRPRQIRELRSALILLKTEIGYGTRPLVHACEQITKRIPSPIAQIFIKCKDNLEHFDGLSTYECFKEAIDKEWHNTVLREAEKGIMLDFSKTLGMSDREDQLQHLTLADTNLKIEEQKAREEQVQYEKMYKTIGVLSGILIIILMI